MDKTAVTASSGAAAYAERMKRIMDAVELRQPDRTPIAFFSTFWAARYGGISYRQAMYDYDTMGELTKRAVLELQPDFYIMPHQLTLLGPIMDQLGYKQLQWPGHGTDVNASYEYLDHEYMKPEEYDDYLLDPTGYFLSQYLPRVGEAFEGLADLPIIPALYYIRLMVGIRPFSKPSVVESLARIQKTAEEVDRLMLHSANFAKEMAALGFPLSHGAGSIAPFDFFGDYLRGSKGIMLDMFRRKDKLLAAMERALHFILKQAILGAKASPSKFVFIPLHWGLDGFMSLAQFKTFYWPGLRKLILGLIEADLIPVLLWEGDCTSRLETIADIPRGKAVYWFERTDLLKAKEVLGDVVCLRGNVPTSMMVTGTPDQVDAYCRRLIEKAGKGGGLILDAACGIPDESRVENVRAMFQAAKKYSA